MAGKYVISKQSNGEFHFVLKAGNGQVILSSESYKAKASCIEGIDSVRKNSQIDGRYQSKTASDGREYFVLIASNGQVIGTSQLYKAGDSRENGIASVKENGPSQTLEDNTV
ncbi:MULTISPECIES: YegP family protein [unclassified Lysobacter]|uniref:YegP family protein n=1 Tax=unclassified Lysobacter TaxID=2635362 RepID=UPI001BEA3BBC|nr:MULTISPECIES: YegP family protein [unclassified Lysobacter]MBT2746412.1 YegP family protein [Lysobacter sp. ISL-42]MBT2753231.1 YegP family protein [Lysobacter sp. ISL-50]MBT2776594.1 YegP family protein [Lysobacter sp. ISL-54]MBT2783311.1 YegP family protein [Lysobacter sp. ISL-52]